MKAFPVGWEALFWAAVTLRRIWGSFLITGWRQAPHVILQPKKTNVIFGYINRIVMSKSREVIFLLYLALVQSLLQHYVQFWHHCLKKDAKEMRNLKLCPFHRWGSNTHLPPRRGHPKLQARLGSCSRGTAKNASFMGPKKEIKQEGALLCSPVKRAQLWEGTVLGINHCSEHCLCILSKDFFLNAKCTSSSRRRDWSPGLPCEYPNHWTIEFFSLFLAYSLVYPNESCSLGCTHGRCPPLCQLNRQSNG